jgi:hypothetical protein
MLRWSIALTVATVLCGCASKRRDALTRERAERESGLGRVPSVPYGDDRPCRIHGTSPELDSVPIVYGLLRYEPGYLKARRERFPNANTWFAGGCVSTWDSPHTRAVYYCPDCRTALAQWERVRQLSAADAPH